MSVDEYIAAQPPQSRELLEQVRSAIRKAVPQAEETISYNIPAYKLNGRAMLSFAGWKKHWSIYPVSGRMRAELADQLRPYQAAKATLQFPLDQPVPVKLISRIAKLRANEME